MHYTLRYDKQCGIDWLTIVTEHDLIGEFDHWEFQDASNRKFPKMALGILRFYLFQHLRRMVEPE